MRVPYAIRKRGDQWCVVKKDGSKTFGCHDSEEKAKAQLAVIGMRTHEGKVPIEIVEALCPSCADSMRSRGWTHLDSAVLVEAVQKGRLFEELNLSDKTISGLCKKVGTKDPGFHTRCSEMMSGKVDSPEAFCNALHYACLGTYPGEHKRKTKEAQSLEDRRTAVRAALEDTLGSAYPPGGGSGWSIVATFDDFVIVEQDGSLSRYPVAFDLFGAVTLGTPAPVQVVYQTLKENVGSAILGPLIEEGKEAKPGSKWAVCVVEEGLSANRTEYPAAVLRAASKLYENVPVFWNHRTGSDSAMPDPRDTAGVIRHPEAAVLEVSGKTAILAEMHTLTTEARERLLEAHEAGTPNVYGLSHTAVAETERVRLADGPALRVKAIKAVESVDIVSFPSAGGRVLRLVAGMSSPVPVTQEELVMLEKKLARLKEARPDLYAKLGATPTEDEVDALLLEAMQPAPKGEMKPEPKPDAAGGGLSQADRALLHEARVDRVMRGREFGPLTDLARDTLIAKVDVKDEDLQKVAEAFVTKAAKIAEGKPAGTGAGGTVEVNHDEADKMVSALEGFFAQTDINKIARFNSIREAYIAITGDQRVTGLVKEAKGIGRFDRLTEGLQSANWANVLNNTMNRQLVRDYNAAGGAYSDTGAGWLYTVVPLNDFKTNERVRFGGYGNLSTVAEGNPYPVLTSPTDEKATYAATKKGGTETVTYEMIRNDDVGAVRRIPQRMAMAARRTLYEFAHNLYATNPNIYDGTALFVAGHGGNLVASALAAGTYTAARLIMLKQAEKDSAKRLGLILRHLMIPPDLEETAVNLFRRTTENDPKFIMNPAMPTIHVITHLTDTTDWFACAGVDQVEQIEIGFLDGRQEPELFVADLPTGGSLFAADKIDHKLRHVYNGAVLDYRGFFGAYGV